MNLKWDQRFLRVAREIAGWSKDRSTKVGCVITTTTKEILATGFNGLPRRLCDNVEERHQRPEKYLWFEHAERNAIANAASRGIAIAGSVIYISSYPSKMLPCADCAKMIIQSGIWRVVTETPASAADGTAQARWQSHVDVSLQMFREAGIQLDSIRYIDDTNLGF